jgi:hypothetical protein
MNSIYGHITKQVDYAKNLATLGAYEDARLELERILPSIGLLKGEDRKAIQERLLSLQVKLDCQAAKSFLDKGQSENSIRVLTGILDYTGFHHLKLPQEFYKLTAQALRQNGYIRKIKPSPERILPSSISQTTAGTKNYNLDEILKV